MNTLKIVKLPLRAPLTLQRGGFIIRYAWLYLAWYWVTFGSKKLTLPAGWAWEQKKINQEYASVTLPKLTFGACFTP